MRTRLFFSILILFFFSCQDIKKQDVLSFHRDSYDKIVFVSGDRVLEFPLKKDKTVIKFNDCKAHLLQVYKDNKITNKSLSMCETNLSILKENGKYYMAGKLNLYDSYSFYTLFGVKAQVFNKKTIGVMTDFERFVYDLKTKGDELKEGLNTKDSYDGIKIYIITKKH